MKENNYETITTAPKVQKFDRMNTIQKEHKDALERAVSLKIPHANAPEEEPLTRNEESVGGGNAMSSDNETKSKSASYGGRPNWDVVLEKLLRNESGEFLLKKDTNAPQ